MADESQGQDNGAGLKLVTDSEGVIDHFPGARGINQALQTHGIMNKANENALNELLGKESNTVATGQSGATLAYGQNAQGSQTASAPSVNSSVASRLQVNNLEFTPSGGIVEHDMRQGAYKNDTTGQGMAFGSESGGPLSTGISGGTPQSTNSTSNGELAATGQGVELDRTSTLSGVGIGEGRKLDRAPTMSGLPVGTNALDKAESILNGMSSSTTAGAQSSDGGSAATSGTGGGSTTSNGQTFGVSAGHTSATFGGSSGENHPATLSNNRVYGGGNVLEDVKSIRGELGGDATQPAGTSTNGELAGPGQGVAFAGGPDQNKLSLVGQSTPSGTSGGTASVVNPNAFGTGTSMEFGGNSTSFSSDSGLSATPGVPPQAEH